jgi:hypothetical protein
LTRAILDAAAQARAEADPDGVARDQILNQPPATDPIRSEEIPMDEKFRVEIEDAVTRALEAGATPEEVRAEVEYAIEAFEDEA